MAPQYSPVRRRSSGTEVVGGGATVVGGTEVLGLGANVVGVPARPPEPRHADWRMQINKRPVIVAGLVARRIEKSMPAIDRIVGSVSR